MKTIKEPNPRYVTGDAILTLAKDFDYPCHSNMQDWEYEVAKLDDIDKYFAKYDLTDDDDIRFLLMEMILETSNENRHFDWMSEIWPRVQPLLKEKFVLHEYTVYHWCSFEIEKIEDCFDIAASMRRFWDEQLRKS